MKTNDSMKHIYPLKFSEEVGNCISHGVMGLLLLFSLPYFSIYAYQKGGAKFAIGIAVYFICLYFMFTVSCLYHAMKHETTHKYIFRKLDHIMILLAIAGTYTPICLSLMDNIWGILILIIEWLMVLAGILLKAISSKAHPKLSMTIYMVMGWMAVLVIPVLIQKGSIPFLVFIILGGILYTIGTLFYRKPQKYMFHFVWHIFIVLASISHLLAILFFMI